MEALKKYGMMGLALLGAVTLGMWAYVKFVKGNKPGFGAPKDAV